MRLRRGLLTDIAVRGGAVPPWKEGARALAAFFADNDAYLGPHAHSVMASPPTIATQATAYSGFPGEYSWNNGTSSALAVQGGYLYTLGTSRRFPCVSLGPNVSGNVGGMSALGETAIDVRVSITATTDEVMWRVNSNRPVRISIQEDGGEAQYASLSTTTPTVSGGAGYVKVTMPTSAKRTWSIESGTSFGLYGPYLKSGVVPELPAFSPLQALFLGDSFIGATGTPSGRPGDVLSRVWADMLGMRYSRNSGSGGTGWKMQSPSGAWNLLERLSADCLTQGPFDIIFTPMGLNDHATTSEEETALYDAVISGVGQMRAQFPAAPIIGVLPWNADAPSPRDTNNAAKSAVLQAAYEDLAHLGVGMLDPANVTYANTGPHPDGYDGHRTLGLWGANATKDLIETMAA